MLKDRTDSLVAQAVMENCIYGIFIIDPEGIVLFWSQGASSVQGYTAEETLGKSFGELYEKQIRKESGYFKALLEYAIKFNHYEEEGWRQRKDGTIFWTSMHIAPIYDTDKNLTSFILISRDLTEKKLPAEINEITEAEHRGDVLSTSNITWTRSFEGEFLSPHLQWELLTGQQWPKYLGFGWLEMHPPEEREKIKQFWQNLTTSDFQDVKGNWEAIEDPKIAGKLTLKTKLWSKIHNEYRFFVTSVVPCFRGKDTIQAWAGNEKDMHKSTLAELRLQQAFEQQKLMVSSARIGMWHIDLQSNSIKIDGSIASLLSINKETFKNTFDEILSCIYPDDRENFISAIQKSKKCDDSYDIQLRVILKDKSLRYLAGRGKVVLNADSSLELLNTFWDISEAQKLFEAQERAKVIEEKMREQHEFVDTVCHEVRNPLNGILGTLDEINDLLSDLTKIDTPDRFAKWSFKKFLSMRELLKTSIETMENCGSYQKEVINKVIEISKAKNKTLPINKEAFSLQEAIKNVTQACSAEIRKGNLTLNFEVPEDEIWINSDPTILKQILLNIFSNAIKNALYEEAIGIKLSILEQVANHITCEIAIRDGNQAFTKAQKLSLFSRFMPITHHCTSKYDNSGLALSLSSGLTQLLGGTTRIEKNPDGINTFYLTFNFEKGMKPEENLLQAGDSSLVFASGDGKKILVVDDNIINQKVLSRILGKIGFECQIAGDGQEAIDKYLSFEPDFIFMDIEMPKKNGLEATQEIRELEKSKKSYTPIYILTGYATDQHYAAAIKAGADSFITKPIKPLTVYETLSSYFEAKESSDTGSANFFAKM